MEMAGESRFAELKRLLEGAGYRLVQIHGSHHIFTRPDSPLLSIPVHRGKVKSFYVRQVEKIINRDRTDD
ncbi:MAG: type II toxin-antitoxin system HicA family toxin [Planctomycetes bacterium]|nr:type II toxin-antitoxin system HicA family toxin [Planctomycetota bacterium]